MRLFLYLFFIFYFIEFAWGEISKIDPQQTLEIPFGMAKSPLDSIGMFQYLGVILILLSLLIILWYVKNFLNKKENISFNIFKHKTSDSPMRMIANYTLSVQTKLIIFEAYKMRYFCRLYTSPSPRD